MIRALAGACGGAILIVAFVAYWAWYAIPAHGAVPMQCGVASWYGTESGSRTATGEAFDGSGYTAAMPSRKHLGERYRVHYGHRSVVVRINDIGPALRLHRIIDLSRAAAASIGLIGQGVGTVCLERLSVASP